MKPFVRAGAAILLLALAGSAFGGAWSATEPPASECVRFWSEVRYRNYGYDHVVHLHNGCSVRASCLVSSDINPGGVRVGLASNEDVEVFTSRGSHAREFTPRVDCRFEVST